MRSCGSYRVKACLKQEDQPANRQVPAHFPTGGFKVRALEFRMRVLMSFIASHVRKRKAVLLAMRWRGKQ
jgi:hypothetical protein